ncbi:LPXTG-domain-containing protein cell wall anchor domain [Enterococcus caccae]|nr:LPXTG-domain-containing protein cell wall anchor domain [Enterococcus caccae]
MIVSFTFALTLAIVYPLNAAAKANGGEVQTNGVISFYEDSSSTESSSVPELTTSDSKVAKPVGRYPSTGEMVKTSLVFTGVALVVIVLLLLFWKRKKEHEGREER